MHAPQEQLRPKDFPPLLRETPSMPKRLYIKGAFPPHDRIYLCVVGSRACSTYGRRMTHSLIAGLASAPVVIVSGLAHGIDTEAHKAALDVGLPTVAVVPSSLDEKSLYPASNIVLARSIVQRGGCLVSEHGSPFIAMMHSFAERNRIMAGMSQATLIIEAGEKSGTLITAKLALDYNREILAIPHELGKPGGIGVNRLLREGATLVRDSADITQALGLKSTPTQHTLPTDLTEYESRVLTLLATPLLHDEVIVQSALSAQDASIALSSLLLRGLIIERLGKIERV